MNNIEYKQLIKDIQTNADNESVENLKKLKFIVNDNYNKKEAINKIIQTKTIKAPNPSMSYILLTDECNFRCKYCYIENALSSKRSFMNENQADNIIKIIKNNSKNIDKYKIIFYGGEPLLNIKILKYFVEQFEAINKDKFKFSIITNGSLMNDEIAKYFKEHAFGISLSLDGWGNLNKNRVYKNNNESFFDVIKALSILKQNGISPGISCTVTKFNYLFLDKIVDFFYELGVKAIGFNIILDATNKDYAVEDPKILAYYLFRGFTRAQELNIYEDRIGRRRAESLFNEIPKFYDCPAYGQQIAFSPKGTLGPCQAFFTADLYQDKIANGFLATKNPLMYEWIKMGIPLYNEECWNCPALGLCGGSCAYDIYTKTGKLGFIDKYSCTVINEILRYLLEYYYYKEIKKIVLIPLNLDYLEHIKKLINDLKKEEDSQMELYKIIDIDKWIGYNIRNMEMKKGYFLLAINNSINVVVGFSNVVWNQNKKRFELGIAIKQEYRRKGIATDLLNKIIKKMNDINIKEVYALSKKKNTASITLLTKNNFTKIGEEEDSFVFINKILK